MISAPIPDNDRQRLADLHALGLLEPDLDPAYEKITAIARQLFGVSIAAVSLVESDRQRFRSGHGLDRSETPRDVAFCAHAILDDEILVVEDATVDDRFHDNPLVAGSPNIRFYAGAPIRSPRGSRLGTLCVIDGESRVADSGNLEALRHLADLVEREIAQASVAVTDSLTGLFNRRGFMLGAERLLAVADRSLAPISIVVADIDGLKNINDTAGHGAGDDAIRTCADLLRRTFRSADVVARTGGDEFAALLYGATSATAGIAVRRLHEATAARNADHPDHAAISMSLGVARREALEQLAPLVERADHAMYKSKVAPAERRGRRGGRSRAAESVHGAAG